MLILWSDSIYDIALHIYGDNGRAFRALYGMDASLYMGNLFPLLMHFHWNNVCHEHFHYNKLWDIRKLGSPRHECL